MGPGGVAAPRAPTYSGFPLGPSPIGNMASEGGAGAGAGKAGQGSSDPATMAMVSELASNLQQLLAHLAAQGGTGGGGTGSAASSITGRVDG